MRVSDVRSPEYTGPLTGSSPLSYQNAPEDDDQLGQLNTLVIDYGQNEDVTYSKSKSLHVSVTERSLYFVTPLRSCFGHSLAM